MLSSDKRIAVRLVITVVVIAAAVWGGILVTRPYRNNAKLSQARHEAEAILIATNQQEVTRHARKCVSLVQPLASQPGRLGSTAMVFLVATASMANTDVGPVRLPDQEALTLVSDWDLLTATRLMVLSGSFDPADRLAGILLDRTSPGAPRGQEDDAGPISPMDTSLSLKPERDGPESRTVVGREEALRMAIAIAYELHRDEDVFQHCDELSALVPDDFMPHQAKSLVYRRQGRLEEFIATATVSAELADQADRLQAGDLMMLIDAYLELDEPAQARRELDRLAERWPDALEEIKVLHARLLMVEGDTGRAETLLRESLAEDRENSGIVLLLGTLLVKEKRFDEAIETLEYAIHLSPGEERAFEQLQQALVGSGDDERAGQIDEYRQFLQEEKARLKVLEEQAAEEPRNVAVRIELAQSYARLGMKEQAEFWHGAAQAAE